VHSRFIVSIMVSALALSGCQTPTTVQQATPEESVVIPEVVTPVVPPTEQTVEAIPVEPAFDREMYSLDEPDSLWVIVNKTRTFNPVDYAPANLVTPDVPSSFEPLLREEVAVALRELFDAAEADGVNLKLQSSYRSYRVQKRIKADSVANWGQSVSDGRSARAGHSEHQSGLAVDLTGSAGTCTLQECFSQTPEGLWLADNSWRFGFILRYLDGATPITGYVFEPWHFRYVGLELAEEIWNQGYPTLEEFFGLDPAPDYVD
jgi:zinc D-Ala-D-Ala carboxypeptidase